MTHVNSAVINSLLNLCEAVNLCEAGGLVPVHTCTTHNVNARRKGLIGYCFKYIDRPFCLRTENYFYH